MNIQRHRWFKNTLVLFLCGLVIVSCQKALNPFSAKAIQPPKGKINVYVLEKGTPIPNVTIKASDPSNGAFTTITDSHGIAILNPIPFVAGNWNIQVPSQENFFNSSLNVDIPADDQAHSVTFQTDPSTITLLSETTTYPKTFGPVTCYLVGYQPMGNLFPKAVLSATGFPNAGWVPQFFPPFLGDPNGNTLSQMVVSVPDCSYEKPGFQVQTKSTDQILLSSSQTVTISRGYSIPVTVSVINLTTSSDSGVLGMTGNIKLTTQYDCGVTWTVNVRPNNGSVSFWYLNGSPKLSGFTGSSFTAISGQSVPFSYYFDSLHTSAVFNCSVSSSIGSSGSQVIINNFTPSTFHTSF